MRVRRGGKPCKRAGGRRGCCGHVYSKRKFVWSHRFQNMIILVGFILFFRFATVYALERINYSTR